MEDRKTHDDMPIMLGDDQEQERLSQRLREAREYLGLSQEFVAEQLEISRAAVSAMETGRRKVSSLELKQLARLYRRNYEYFLGEEEVTEPEDAIAQALFRTTKKLSDQDREQVLKFAQFLRQSEGGPRGDKDTEHTTD